MSPTIMLESTKWSSWIREFTLAINWERLDIISVFIELFSSNTQPRWFTFFTHGRSSPSSLIGARFSNFLGFFVKTMHFVLLLVGFTLVPNFKFFLLANLWQVSTIDCRPSLLAESSKMSSANINAPRKTLSCGNRFLKSWEFGAAHLCRSQIGLLN